MAKEDDIRYAVNSTRVLVQPRQSLETFGSTTIRYHLVSELMDEVDTTRVREGKVVSERPRLILPNQFAQQLLEGFGEQARDYADWLRQHNEMMRIIRYGLQFRKDETSQQIIHEDLDTVAERVKSQVENSDDPLTTVVVGADELWEVCLLKFVVDFIEHSAPSNINDFRQREREDAEFRQQRVHDEIEADFAKATLSRDHLSVLAEKLQRFGVFEQYEDRFYALVNRQR